MKIILTILMVPFLLFTTTVYGRDVMENISASDSAYYCSFFPMHVGDKWVYKTDYGGGDAFYYYYEIVMDTVDSLNRHWYGRTFKGQNKLCYYTITDSFEVVYGFPDSNVTNIVYKLNAKQGEQWLIWGNYNQGYVAIVDTIYDLGSGNIIMKIDEWNYFDYEPLLWESSKFLRTGIGLVETWWEAGPPTYLVGAIIDGVIYGNPSELDQEKLSIIYDFHLYQNYPNPFNLYTTIPFYLNRKGIVDFNIYDILGRIIYTKESSYYTEGYKTFIWDGTDKNNKPVSSGIYIYELSSGENKKRMKMTLNK